MRINLNIQTASDQLASHVKNHLYYLPVISIADTVQRIASNFDAVIKIEAHLAGLA